MWYSHVTVLTTTSDVASHVITTEAIGHTRANSHAVSRLALLPARCLISYETYSLRCFQLIVDEEIKKASLTHLAFVLRQEKRHNVSPITVSDELRKKKCYEFASIA